MEQIIATVLSCVISAIGATVVALINSNANAARTEQKFADALETIQKENAETKQRLLELKETDSCCTLLQKDVKDIKESIELLSATVNQFKAESDMADEATRETLKALCRDRINQGHRYFMKRGEIDERSKESLLSIGDCYTNILNGNTFVGEEIEDLKELKVVPLP